jgi:prophage regulatory protein
VSHRILRRPDVEAATGLSRSTLYSLIARSEFPKPVPLGPASVGWLDSEIQDWIAERAARRDQSA